MDTQNWSDPNQRMTEYSRQSPPYQERAPWQDANADSDHQRISSSTTAQTMSTSSCSFSSCGNQYQQNASPQGSLSDQRRYPSVQNQSGSMQLQGGSHQPPHQSQHFGSQGQMSYQYGQQPQMFPQQHPQGSPSQPSYHCGQQTPPAPQSQGHQSSCNGQSGMNDQQAAICAAASQDMMQLATSSLAGVRQSPNYDHLRVSVDPNSGNSDPKTTSIKVVSTTTKKKETSAHKKREKKTEHEVQLCPQRSRVQGSRPAIRATSANDDKQARRLSAALPVVPRSERLSLRWGHALPSRRRSRRLCGKPDGGSNRGPGEHPPRRPGMERKRWGLHDSGHTSSTSGPVATDASEASKIRPKNDFDGIPALRDPGKRSSAVRML